MLSMSTIRHTPVRVTMLGCGGSEGVPTPMGDWGKCDPDNPRNRRSRVSVRVDAEDRTGALKTLVIDTSPDFRQQMIASGTTRIDAVLFTHAHADHCHGIDDLRQVFHAIGRPVVGHARESTLRSLRTRVFRRLLPALR